MSTIKINKTNLDQLKKQLPVKGQVFYFDVDLKGFGIKATPSGLIFIVQRKIRRDVKRHIVGKHGEIHYDEARRRAAKALSQLRDGIDLNKIKKQEQTAATSLREAYAAFKASRPLRSRHSKPMMKISSGAFPDWLDKPITSITKEMIETKYKELSNANGPRGKGEASADQAMRLLRAILNYANVTYEDINGAPLLPTNPVKRLSQVRLWNRPNRRQDVVQPHDLEAWYKATTKLDSATMRDYLLVCLFTGLRRSEAMKLKWGNIDFKAKTLTVPGTDTKNHDSHRLPLSDFLQNLMDQRSKVRRTDNDYVFAAEVGTSHIVEPKRAVASVVKFSGAKFSMHTPRRTFITTAESLDISHYALKRLLNHRTSNDVTSNYIVIEVERLRKPMQQIADELKLKMGIVTEIAIVESSEAQL